MMHKSLRFLRLSPYLAPVLTLAGAVVFTIQLWVYAHHQTSILDEGAYLYLGYHFVGVQDLDYGTLGLWNSYGPLAFLIPGSAQSLFGPGLRTGRYFAIFVAVLILLALWVCARRLGGKWWGAAAVWAVALAPMQIKMFSLGMSQGLTACLLTWTLVCVIGEKRPFWQLMLGAMLAGLTVMLRQNLLPLIPLTVGYIFWQHGRKAGWWAILASLIPALAATVIFWPSILRLWTFFWNAGLVFPFLQRFGAPAGTLPITNPVNAEGLQGRLAAFFLGFRVHYLPLVGVGASILLWSRRWKDQVHKRAAYFLAALFISLFLLHAWVTLWETQCTFCLHIYTAFFSNVGLLLVVVTFSSWVERPSLPRQIAIVLFILLLSLALGQATYDRLGPWLLALPVPRVSGGIHLGEWATLANYISNKLHMDYFTARLILPPFFGLLVGVFVILAVLIGWRFLRRRRPEMRNAFGSSLLIVTLLLGYGFSPLMNGSYRQDGDCDRDVIASYEQVGEELAGLIPADAWVFWNVRSAVPLLYVGEFRFHPAEIFGVFTYRIGGNAQAVEESGYWNEELARRWMSEADVLVLEDSVPLYTPALEDVLDLSAYTLNVLPPVNPCQPYSDLLVYRKLP
jgi:hypothetical protein